MTSTEQALFDAAQQIAGTLGLEILTTPHGYDIRGRQTGGLLSDHATLSGVLATLSYEVQERLGL